MRFVYLIYYLLIVFFALIFYYLNFGSFLVGLIYYKMCTNKNTVQLCFVVVLSLFCEMLTSKLFKT
jgi:hypothetical protein